MEALTQFLQTIPGAIILLVIGFVGLIKGADFFVEGASNVAKRLRVPSLIIGLTIVAMGTSLPETAVSISASIAGSNSLAISNVSGSNLFNLLVVVGLCAIFQISFCDIFCTEWVAWHQDGLSKSPFFCINVWCFNHTHNVISFSYSLRTL